MALAGFVLGAIWVAFDLPLAIPYQPLYLLFIPVIWAAVRYGVPGATLTTFTINIGLMMAAYFTHSRAQGLPRLQLAMLALALTGLCLGAVVSERKQAEEELRLSDYYLAESQRLSHIGSWVWNVAKREIEFWSEEHYRIFGMEPGTGTVPVKEAQNRIHPDDLPLFQKILNESLAEKNDYEVDLRLILPNGSMRNIRSTGHPVINTAGDLVQFVGTCMDITERKRAEQELRLTQFSVDHASDTMLCVDPRGRFVYVNEAGCRAYGHSREELLSQSIPDIDPLFPRQAWGAFWEELKEKGSLTFQAQHQTKLGKVFPVELTANYLEFDGQEYSFAFVRDISERLRAEESIRKSERFLQSTLDALSSHVAILNEGGEVLAVNAAWNRFTTANGGRREQCGVGSNYLEVCKRASGGASAATEGIRKAIAGSPDEFSLEYQCNSPKQRRWFLMKVTPFAEEGSAGVVVAHENITNRKLAEERLRDSERRYRLLFERNLAGVLRTNLEGRVLECNQAAARMFGYDSLEEVLQLSSTSLHESMAAHEAYLSQLKSCRSLTNHEMGFQRKDGAVLWVIANVTLVDEAGAEGIIEATLVDITDRKQAEEVRERLAALVESSNDAILGKTLDGVITAWNPGAERLFGYSSSEAVGSSIRMLIPADRANEEKEILSRVRRGERIEQFETVRVRKDGRKIDVSVTISPIKDGSGVVVGSSKIARDITDSKRAEEEMRRAKETAEAANRAKSQFLANMSHEIRTPMNGVIGVAGLLLDTDLTPEQRQYAGIVRTSGEALLNVINDTLDFSKIEARKMTLERSDFDLNTVLQDSVTVLAMKAKEKGIQLKYEMEPGIPCFLRGDPGRLRQILINLLGNAVKFTQRGEVAVRAGIENDEATRAMLRFTVRDTGIGFPQERASSLFEPFIQADGSSTRRYGGTGLGLTISKQLVELMGGRIGVESKEGKGSTFWVTAAFDKQPRTTAIANAKATVPEIAEGPVSPLPNKQEVKGMRILLAEDNLINQQVALAMLDKLGYGVKTVGNGAEAIEALRRGTYDLVLMDCMMPQMDGYEATRRIREQRTGIRNPQIPIIALTADAMSGDRDKCLQAGMSDYITKPVDLGKLAEVLKKWLTAESASKKDLPASGAPARTEVVFDQEEFMARLMGDKNLADKVVSGFLCDAPRQLLNLKKKIEAGDIEDTKRLAHTVKGVAATMSAEAMRAVSFEMQEAAAAGKLDRAAALLPQLQQQFELVKKAMKQWGWV
jgi:PAS domain S-box-containing protein